MTIGLRVGCPGAPEGVGGRGIRNRGIGRSRGGLTSRIAAVEDALGCFVRFVILPGQAHDPVAVPELPTGLPFGTLIRDRAFDAGWLPEEVGKRRAEAVIPSKRTRTHRTRNCACYSQPL